MSTVLPQFAPEIHQPPVIIVPERVIAAMAAETERYMQPETGEAMVGLVVPPAENDPFREPVFYILGTIPSDTADRHNAMLELGGEGQVRIYKWLKKNWDAMRENYRTRPNYHTHRWGQKIPGGEIPKIFDLDLQDLGDWHKHPRGMTYPSGGDLGTVLDTLTDPNLNVRYMIAPVVTISQAPERQIGVDGGLVQLQDGGFAINVSFSYLSGRMIQKGIRDFITVIPNVVPNQYLPDLPVLSWDLRDPDRLGMELGLLEDYGCSVEMVHREVRGGPPLEVCFVIKRPKCERPWDYSVFIETTVDYPYEAPALRIVKDESPEDPGQRITNRPAWLRWILSLIDKAPLLPLPELLREDTNSTFTWRADTGTLLNLIMFLEKGGKVWKSEQTVGTE